MIACVIGVLTIIGNADKNLIGDTLGGAIAGEVTFKEAAYGQTVGQLASSISDTNIHIVLGLFVINGFALGFDSKNTRRRLAAKLVPLFVFAFSAILAVYFAIKYKAALLWQINFDRVNIELLESALRWQLIFLLGAALASFVVVLLSLIGLAPQEGAKND